MKILQINSNLNVGSTGKIVEGIGLKVLNEADESYAAYGRNYNNSALSSYKIGNKLGMFYHLLFSRITDRQGFYSTKATKKLIEKIEIINPDIIHLHNLHGYYLNIEILFNYLSRANKPIVWTLHDCWAFTGHCCYFTRVDCTKWITGCNHCPLTKYYPQSYFIDNSSNNYLNKKELFNKPKQMVFVTVSKWLNRELNKSFLKSYSSEVIYNGVNLEIFKPKSQHELKNTYGFESKKIILGVANVWSDLKGLNDFLRLSKSIDDNTIIILIGLTQKQIKQLPSNIIGIQRTSDQHQLAEYYSMADVFICSSIAESFGLVIAESIACGTPAIVYNTSAMPELIQEGVGYVVERGDINAVFDKIKAVFAKGKESYSNSCREFALNNFDEKSSYEKYHQLYTSLLENKK